MTKEPFPTEGKPGGRRRGASTTRSTAGPGYSFEDLAAAWLLTKMLVGEPLPLVDFVGRQLLFQAAAVGWKIDDLQAVGVGAGSEVRRLAISCKSSEQVSAAGLPIDFVEAAWTLWTGPDSPMDQKQDGLALITRGRKASFDEPWGDIRNWCQTSEPELAIARIQGTAKHLRIFERLRDGATPGTRTDQQAMALVRHITVIPLDFQLDHSEARDAAVGRCRALLKSGALEEGHALWDALINQASKARLGGGSIRIDDLWMILRSTLQLKDRPDLAGSWTALSGLSQAYRQRIATVLSNGVSLPRAEISATFADALQPGAFVRVTGDSGIGKSALVAAVLDAIRPDAAQIWLGPAESEALLSPLSRGAAGLSTSLEVVLTGSRNPDNFLVVDAVERLKRIELTAVSGLVHAVRAAGWTVILVGQTDEGSEIAGLIAGGKHLTGVRVDGLTINEVREALLGAPALTWLVAHPEALTALTNLKILDWVVQSSAALGEGATPPRSMVEIVDRIWRAWTDGKLSLQRLLIRFAVREAEFERSFAVSDLDAAEAQQLEAATKSLPLRTVPSGRLAFEHDLASDWARFHRLKELAADVPAWSALATRPRWTAALRLLGQHLLRVQDGDATAWDTAFQAVEAGDQTLAGDILLESLFLDPQGQTFLADREELLFADHGQRLNRLLLRFLHVATQPNLGLSTLPPDPSLSLFLEAQFRTPIPERWGPLVRFLVARSDAVAKLISLPLAKLCQIWLTQTPLRLVDQSPTPLRQPLADIALKAARALQAELGKSIIYTDDGHRAVFEAALAAGEDLPQAVATWALEMAQRRPQAAEVTAEIEAYRQEAARLRRERMQSDPVYRAQQAERTQKRRSAPISLSSYSKLPAWLEGPQSKVDRHFRHVGLQPGALAPLARARPTEAAELTVALMIEDDPREDHGVRFDARFGLAFETDGYPTAYWKGPFLSLLMADVEAGLTALIALVNFATDRWAENFQRHTGRPPEGLFLTEATAAHGYFGEHRAFSWSQTNSSGGGLLRCALASLEWWLRQQADHGLDLDPTVERLFSESRSTGVLGVLVNLVKYQPALLKGPLLRLLAQPELFAWDDERARTSNLSFDGFAWSRAGTFIFELAKAWTFAEYRKTPLAKVVMQAVADDPALGEALVPYLKAWSYHPAASTLTLRVLQAELDHRRLTKVVDEVTGEAHLIIDYPEALRQDATREQAKRFESFQDLQTPYQCERLLKARQPLDDEGAALVAASLRTALANDQPDNRGRLALGAVLIVLAPAWLARVPDLTAAVDALVRQGIAEIGEEAEVVQRDSIQVTGEATKFAAYAVAGRWCAAPTSPAWDEAVLRLLTSGEMAPVAILSTYGFDHRQVLGPVWTRYLYLAALWSAFWTIRPDHVGGDRDRVRWNQWLGRLRGLSLRPAFGTTITLGDLDRRLKRFWQLRPDRKEMAEDRVLQRSYRSPPAIATYMLQPAYVWLLGEFNQPGMVTAADAPVLLDFWTYELSHLRRGRDRDKDLQPLNGFGSAVVEAMARCVVDSPAADIDTLWRSILTVGAPGHYLISSFLDACFFAVSQSGRPIENFLPTWTAMIEYGLEHWKGGDRWFYNEQLLRELLSFGTGGGLLKSVPGIEAVITAMVPVYHRWADERLVKAERNMQAFSAFLASDLGRPLRLDGVVRLAAGLSDASRTGTWFRDGLGDSLVECLDVLLTQNLTELRVNAAARDAVIAISAVLAGRHVAAALALQERVKTGL